MKGTVEIESQTIFKRDKMSLLKCEGMTMSDVDKMSTSEGKTRDFVASQISQQTGKKLSGKTYESEKRAFNPVPVKLRISA
jgi:hypothetical protein